MSLLRSLFFVAVLSIINFSFFFRSHSIFLRFHEFPLCTCNQITQKLPLIRSLSNHKMMKKKYRWQIDKKAKTESFLHIKSSDLVDILRNKTRKQTQTIIKRSNLTCGHKVIHQMPSNWIFYRVSQKKMSSIYSFPAQCLLKTDKIQNRIKN